MATTRPIDVLVVEDDVTDVTLIRESLEETANPPTLHIVRDGAEAIAYLRHQPPYENAPTPDLVFLDLNMPRVNGHEVLQDVKSDERLRVIPVVILTTTNDPDTIRKSYQLHANAFISKPFELDSFMRTVGKAYEYWAGVVDLARS